MKKFFKEHDLVKLVSLVLILVIVCSWFIPTGSFSTGATFTEGKVGRLGLAHLFYGFCFALQNYSIQIGFIILIGMFYGVISKTEGYKSLIARLAKIGKKNEIAVTIVVSLVVALLASFLNNTYVLLIFMPFLITALRRMGFDKISSFALTFGAMLVGVLGATYGTEGLDGFLLYISYGGSTATITTELAVRAGILALAYILYTFFNVIYVKKLFSTKKREEEMDDDKFAAEEPKKKKSKVWPTIVMFVILLVFVVLGFTNWNTANQSGSTTFGIKIFDTFHEWLNGLTIGGDDGIAIFQTILGGTLPNLSSSLVPAFGGWYLFTYSVILAVVTVIVAFASKMSLSDFFTNIGEGVKKIIRPIMFITLSYMVFVFLYWVPMIPTIVNELGKMSSGFNPFVTIIQAVIGSFFNTDFAYLGYSLSYYLGNFSGNEGNLLVVIYSTIYGLVQFVTPISVFLLFGLSYMNIPYKKWMKYIWKFLLAMLVCLLVIFALLAYL